MAKYYKVVAYNGDEFQTNETLIDDETFRRCQKALSEGVEFLALPNKVIRASSIKEISPADDIVSEYLRIGMKPEQIGLPMGSKPSELKENSWIDEGLKKIGDVLPKISK